MSRWLASVDATRFGPWAVVTGASSGIGREFARQLAASGIHVVLIARRESLLREVGHELTARYGVRHRVIGADLTDGGALAEIAAQTDDLDVGLAVCNAGTATVGAMLSQDLDVLRSVVRLNVTACLELTHHFGRRLARRGRGGVILVGASGSQHGVPNMANAAATKAYVLTLGKGLRAEFAEHGVTLSVLLPGPTDTPVLSELGFQPDGSPIKPMTVEQCVAEGLDALASNRATHIAGRLNRVMARTIPPRVMSMMMGRMVGRGVGRRDSSKVEESP